MTCQLKPIACIADVEKVKSYLFSNTVLSAQSGDGEDDSWNWCVEEETPTNEAWLDSCCVSLSPSSEILVIAHEKSMAILSAKWDSSAEGDTKVKYHLSWYGDPRTDTEEKITAVLCLPIAAQGRLSAHCGADWTCIAVGFSSGAVRFYTETGGLLVSEVLHDEPIKMLKCETYQPSKNSYLTQQNDELYVIYESIVCLVHGFALCNTLKACRNQLARVQANCGDRVDAPPLAMSKWTINEQWTIQDVCVVGSQTASGFTHLATASVRGGYHASYRPTPPNVSLVLATGSRPFLGFHCIVEGAPVPVLSDVAKAVASKLKSAIGQAVLPGWFGGGRRNSLNEKAKEKPPIEPAEPTACRFGLNDSLRQGLRIVLSPFKNLSAVSDNLGRVILVDNISGIAIRMWKGYRDAHCAFLPVDEEKGNHGRQALFLVIYAPKKGLIEVWALQQGPKVATFLAPKTGNLLYINNGLFGVNSMSQRVSNTSQHPVIFINNCGLIHQIVIPFHTILNNKDNIRAKDLHLLKQIRKSLQSEFDTAELLALCNQVDTSDVCCQVLEVLAASKSLCPSILLSVIASFEEKMGNNSEDKSQEKPTQNCLQACSNLKNLLNFYTFTHDLQEKPPEYNSVVNDMPSSEFQEELLKLLRLTQPELTLLLKYVSNGVDQNDRTKVKFKDEADHFSNVLKPFLLTYTEPPPLKLSDKTPFTSMAALGESFCKCVLYNNVSIDEWKNAAIDSQIEPKSLLQTGICYWISKPHGDNLYSEFKLFTQMVTAICTLTSLRETLSWWDSIRQCISDCDNLTSALSASIVSRAVFLNLEDQLSESGESDWETISKESCLWSQLLTQLEAFAMLNSVICLKPKRAKDVAIVPCLDYVKPCCSLTHFLSKGPGSVSEVVAKWISSWGLPPEWLLCSEKPEPQEPPKFGTEISTSRVVEGILPEIQKSREARPTTVSEEQVLQHIDSLRKHFPHSLSSGSLVANLAWEYVSAWSKDMDKVEYLNFALSCIKAIPNPHLQQGLCSIMWNVHLRAKFEGSARLIHKVGKVPKERLCRQEINVSNENVKDLLKYLVEFLNIFMESTNGAECCEKMEVRRESLWVEDTQPTLTEISLAQAAPNVEILLIQSQCARALHLLASFELKLHRPITTLFDSLGESCLWADIRGRPQLPSRNPDLKLCEARTAYLSKVITAAFESADIDPKMPLSPTVVAWISQCYNLAADWLLPSEPLRRHHVCTLYLQNLDMLAEEIIGSVNDKEKLSADLSMIVGQRLKHLMVEDNVKFKDIMANLSPAVSLWVQEHEPCKLPPDLNDTTQLVSLLVNMIPESSPESNILSLIFEALTSGNS